jgi:hypothetical protein
LEAFTEAKPAVVRLNRANNSRTTIGKASALWANSSPLLFLSISEILVLSIQGLALKAGGGLVNQSNNLVSESGDASQDNQDDNDSFLSKLVSSLIDNKTVDGLKQFTGQIFEHKAPPHEKKNK